MTRVERCALFSVAYRPHRFHVRDQSSLSVFMFVVSWSRGFRHSELNRIVWGSKYGGKRIETTFKATTKITRKASEWKTFKWLALATKVKCVPPCVPNGLFWRCKVYWVCSTNDWRTGQVYGGSQGADENLTLEQPTCSRRKTYLNRRLLDSSPKTSRACAVVKRMPSLKSIIGSGIQFSVKHPR